MKKLLIIIMIIIFPFSSFAESPFPFGIQENASADDVAAAIVPVFGEIITVPGYEDKTWGISPQNKFMYGYEIDNIQMFINADAWKLSFSLKENTPDRFAVRLHTLYNAIAEKYGPVETTFPETYSYDISGDQSMEVIFSDPDQIAAFFSGADNAAYYCKWKFCSLYASIYPVNGEKKYNVSLSWFKE